MKIIENLKILLKSQKALPKPPLTSILGQKGINVLTFCKDFNEKTKKYEKGLDIPIKLLIYKNKDFKLVVKSPTTSCLLKKKLKIEKGSENKSIIREIDRESILEIYEIKKKDLNSYNLESSIKIILGSARSMGIKLKK